MGEGRTPAHFFPVPGFADEAAAISAFYLFYVDLILSRCAVAIRAGDIEVDTRALRRCWSRGFGMRFRHAHALGDSYDGGQKAQAQERLLNDRRFFSFHGHLSRLIFPS